MEKEIFGASDDEDDELEELPNLYFSDDDAGNIIVQILHGIIIQAKESRLIQRKIMQILHTIAPGNCRN